MHISGPRRFKNTQKSTRRHPERGKKSEMVAGEGKKSAKFWAPHPSGPHPSGPHPSGPHPSGPDFFWVWAPPSGPHHDTHTQIQMLGLASFFFGETEWRRKLQSLTREQKLDTTARGHSWRVSFTTSCVRGISVSTTPKLEVRQRSSEGRSSVACNDGGPPQSSRLPRRMRSSDLAFARARSRRKIWRLAGQPTELERERVRPFFLRRSTVRTAPSICAAPGLADPSQWSGETSVVSTNTFTATRPPASRQTLAAALSTANPRLPNTPALGHTARWWPKESRGGPQRHKRKKRGSGRRRRRRKSTRNSRGNACQEIRRSHREGHASIWSTLGTHQGLLRRSQPDHQVAFTKLAQLEMLPRAAIHVSRHLAHGLQVGEGGDRPTTLPTTALQTPCCMLGNNGCKSCRLWAFHIGPTNRLSRFPNPNLPLKEGRWLPGILRSANLCQGAKTNQTRPDNPQQVVGPGRSAMKKESPR